MESVMPSPTSSKGLGILESLRAAAAENCQRLIDGCYTFRKWEREHISVGNATEEEMRQHRQTLEGLLKGIKWMVAISGHPDAFERSYHQKFEVLADQLQTSWDLYYSAPTEQDLASADKVLKDLFPE
jgi:hypothetical protein